MRIRFSRSDIAHISNNICNETKHIPNEFARKLQSLLELAFWKGTEYRLFILYLVPIVLPSVKLPKEIYLRILILYIALRNLTSAQYTYMLDFAEQLLVSFVDEYGTLYGKEQVSYNMHGLIHFVDDCQKFGVLNNFSTFYFEKSFQIFKRKFKKNHQTLARMRNRELEQRHLNSTPIIQMNYPKLIKKIDKNFLIPEVEGIQFKKVKTATFCLSIMDGDNSCIHKDGRILVFESIIDI